MCVSSKNSPVYLWTLWRALGHEFIFDAVDAIHSMPLNVPGTKPSDALRHRTNIILNVYCNAYATRTRQQLCCGS